MNEINRSVKRELRLNKVVTFLHITVILGTTISAFFLVNVETAEINVVLRRTQSSFIALTALQDIFLSSNMFFISY